MTVYERSQLSAEEMDAIQRKQFLPLLRADDQVFEEHYERINAMDYEARTQVAVEIPDEGNESMPVRWIDLADMMRDMSDKLPSWSTVSLGPSTMNNPHICNAYVRLICNHVNAKRGEQWEALRLKKLKKEQKSVKSRGSAKPGRGSPRRSGSPAREGSSKPSDHRDREPLRTVQCPEQL
ncbi:uncharacterized protein L3040_000647 [Drepanopeziza brunnea f. sp. 'multigermtubi']|uniref:uncharacterized protein n=1 Tax=Drepanopeziza brunnea f. sp. 'multigermtubi' TaxID=698441 RepID=UPI00238D8223|nr:hypothetical protein L3040_000647 [Drepanopeziza brunnea f. sp. 'multigermtubi']